QFQRLFETGGELVFGRPFRRLAGPAASVSQKLALCIVDRNKDTIFYAAFGAETEPKISDGFLRQTAFGKIREFLVGILQSEAERFVGCAVLDGARRRRQGSLSALALGLRTFGLCPFDNTRLGTEIEPLADLDTCRADTDTFQFGDKIQDVAALATAKTIPA